MAMNILSTTEAAEIKGVSRQALSKAIKRGEIDAKKVGTRNLVVMDNKGFKEWQPNKKLVDAQKARFK